MYVTVEIYSVEERRINVVCFKADVNKLDNVVIFNFLFHSVDQSRNNVVNVIIFKKLNFQPQKRDEPFD